MITSRRRIILLTEKQTWSRLYFTHLFISSYFWVGFHLVQLLCACPQFAPFRYSKLSANIQDNRNFLQENSQIIIEKILPCFSIHYNNKECNLKWNANILYTWTKMCQWIWNALINVFRNYKQSILQQLCLV